MDSSGSDSFQPLWTSVQLLSFPTDKDHEDGNKGPTDVGQDT